MEYRVISEYMVKIPAFRIDTTNLLSRLAAIYKVPEADLSYDWDPDSCDRVRPTGFYIIKCKSNWNPTETPLTKVV